ncbi:ASCH domain-containing protein [Glycomyces salinus]|uniref:ASCH domain-containing protein n=1 Tax=Glycomyces salinus TaxID=980294 RepID=UPI0018ECF7E9|nr:ASCH domain-containing protein [Glycomyces salinus]
MTKQQGKKLKKLDSFEAEVRAYLERFVAAPVEQHDDNSSGSMPDLRIMWLEKSAAGVEVVRDADKNSVNQSVRLNRQGMFVPAPGLGYDWAIELTRVTDIREARAQLPAILKDAEAAGQSTVQGFMDNPYDPVSDKIARLGIIYARRSSPVKPGKEASITLLNAFGGSWDRDMNIVVTWCEKALMLADDVPAKLLASTFTERHALLAPTWHGDFQAYYALMHHLEGPEPLPTAAPKLPEGVDQVWLWGGRILHWGPDTGWTEYQRPQPQVHRMGLHPEPFSLLKSGLKVTEVRVADEKSRAILPGDDIVFNCEGTELVMTVERIDRYTDFDEVYRYEQESDINPNLDMSAQIVGLRDLYSTEREALGALAIRMTPRS